MSSVLAEGGVEIVVFDTHTIVLEGQIGATPRRVVVVDADLRLHV
ncbi:MAG: DUF2007 domain-containing protein [Pseudomonadota bacterium]|nr:DUF2007 domain-containing protein [Pseudomonadota bacterium]